jgi:hypothetical protein
MYLLVRLCSVSRISDLSSAGKSARGVEGGGVLPVVMFVVMCTVGALSHDFEYSRTLVVGSHFSINTNML